MSSKLGSALQDALAQEHAAVWGYAIVGAHLPDDERKAAVSCLEDHKRARDDLSAQVRAHGATPDQADPGYTLPFDVKGPAKARALAGRLERSTIGAYATLVARSKGATRRKAITAMQAAAVRQASWTDTIDTLPGLRT